MDLNNLYISVVAKAEFKDRFSKIHKQMMDELKAKTKAELKQAVDAVKEFFEKNKDAKTMIARLPISANGKAIGDALKNVQNLEKDKSVYLIAGDEAEGKVVHGCYVSPVSLIFKVRNGMWANGNRTWQSRLLRRSGRGLCASLLAERRAERALRHRVLDPMLTRLTRLSRLRECFLRSYSVRGLNLVEHHLRSQEIAGDPHRK